MATCDFPRGGGGGGVGGSGPPVLPQDPPTKHMIMGSLFRKHYNSSCFRFIYSLFRIQKLVMMLTNMTVTQALDMIIPMKTGKVLAYTHKVLITILQAEN